MKLRPPPGVLLDAARRINWRTVVLNGGPPCFHIAEGERQFCLRAERWDGHGVMHDYVPLHDVILRG